MNIALLVIDMQKAFFAGESRESMENAAEYINYAAGLFRNANKQIIWIQDEDKEDGLLKDRKDLKLLIFSIQKILKNGQ